MGNWVWPKQVPWLGLTQDNPPLASGAFYCLLDLLVVMATRRWVAPEAVPAAHAPSYPASPMSTPSIASHQDATLSARSSSR